MHVIILKRHSTVNTTRVETARSQPLSNLIAIQEASLKAVQIIFDIWMALPSEILEYNQHSRRVCVATFA